MRKYRLYYDKDAEEIWLKDMCQKGWALKKYFLGLYTFEPCTPGEFNYQIDLIQGKSEEFLEFLEESGVTVVGRWVRWVYLQKPAEEGVFEMYTDTDSKIEQYRRIRKFFAFFLALEALCLMVEFFAVIETRSPLYLGIYPAHWCNLSGHAAYDLEMQLENRRFKKAEKLKDELN